MAKGYRYNDVKVIHGRQTGGTDNNTLITSLNLSPLQYYIKQKRQLERVNLYKNNIITINNKINTPSLTRIPMSRSHQYPVENNITANQLTNLNSSQTFHQYDDLQIPRLIRKHERHYTKHES